MKKITLLVSLALVTICLPIISFGQVGSLDLTFDTDGKVTTPISTTNLSDNARAVAIQSDGKIVVAGYSFLGGADYDFAVVRYNADGTLDTSFDTDGKVTTAISSADEDQAYAIAIQSDGKIVVAGYTRDISTYSFAVVRYNSDGSLDNSFDSDGIVVTVIGGIIDVAYSIAIQSDGKIVVAGYSFQNGNNDFAVVRYNIDGSIDTSFDTDGIVTTPVGSLVDMGYAVAIQSDGKIVVAGHSLISSNNYDFSVVRYNTDGSLDVSFDTDGKVITPITTNSDDKAYSLAIQSDGKIVLAGYSYIGALYSYALTRYNSDGSLDTGFDTDGVTTTSFGGETDIAYSVLVQSDGKILASGYSFNGTDNDFAVACYNSDGSLDPGFDTDGIVTIPVGSSVDMGYAAALQADGKIIIAGQSSSGANNDDFAVVRLNSINTAEINTINNIKLSVYPNPADETLYIKSDYPSDIIITSINGKVVCHTAIENGSTIDISTYAPGVYFIRTTEGKTMKFIKE